MNKDAQLINEAYYNMPPQCPPHLLEEGMSHQLHAWVMGKALPWLQKNKGKVAIAGGIAAALAMYLGMDPDTAQQAVDGMDPDVISGLEGGDPTAGFGALADVPIGQGSEAMADYLLDGDNKNPMANIEQNILDVKQMGPGPSGSSVELINYELAQGRIEALSKLKEAGHFDGNSAGWNGHLDIAKQQLRAARQALN